MWRGTPHPESFSCKYILNLTSDQIPADATNIKDRQHDDLINNSNHNKEILQQILEVLRKLFTSTI